jgi:hypothetical protein
MMVFDINDIENFYKTFSHLYIFFYEISQSFVLLSLLSCKTSYVHTCIHTHTHTHTHPLWQTCLTNIFSHGEANIFISLTATFENWMSISFLFFVVLGFESRAYTSSHSTSPFVWWVFLKQGLENYLPHLASNCNPLISASCVPRVIGVSHQCPAHYIFCLCHMVMS